MKKKLTSLICLLVVFSFLLTACGKGNTAGGDNGAAEEGQILYTVNHSEPGSLDPALAQGTHESWILNHLYTGLLSYDKEGKLVDGMAEMPTISEDGLTYTFKIKDGMKWSNGDPVTAEDFAYEWLRVLDPETASEYAYQLYYVKGGEAYNTVEKPGVYYVKDNDGKDTDIVDHEVKFTDADTQGLDVAGKSDDEVAQMVYEKWLEEKKAEVGVKVLDEKTLEVVLENPTPYFADLTAFYTLYPVNSKIVKENPDWAKSGGELYTSNGAFTLKTWEHDSIIELVKNENWFKADDVKLAGITFDILEDINTCWQNYDSGKYSMLVDPPQEVVAQKFEEKNEELVIGKQVGTYYYNLNNIKEAPGAKVNPFTNVNIRKAFVYALDRESLVNNITKGGQIAATGFVPYGLLDDQGKDFREENGVLVEYNPEKAKEFLQKGLDELGLKVEDLDETVILYNTSESHKKIAQAVQQMWKETLGVELGLENVDFNVKIAREHAHDFEISRAGWVGDYSDPMTMLDLFIKGGAMNDSGHDNPEYDALINEARQSADQKVRMDAMKKAEKVLMEDMPIVPIYFYTQPYFVKSNVKGIYKPILQYPVLTFAEIGE
ncbi:peptide ABC transporter substrate-binding protein [Peptoniphilus sp. oral taxon 386]|uniref:peptide ABC transporter substrate-binding protein n=1 Tax=Peptoniphilus sp. oral taxon 386 TaxID=652713 RepID=UPI0001DA9B0C|nr:peptide ABC transporter substrate-binding protein [Peptoniphilus sp. oral taxon 386]EFI42086.1 putative oligopeptide-binding protein OppA [Peptoniphilus sp. oral taxon 386 str. F0131]